MLVAAACLHPHPASTRGVRPGSVSSKGRDETAPRCCVSLQDLVDQHLREHKETPAMQAVMGGTFAQQIICKSVSYRSEKEEDFYQVGAPSCH